MRSLFYFYKVVFLFTLIILCATCKKDNTPPTSLPPATQTGANTFGCKINGEVWVPYSPCDLSASECDEISMDFLPANPNYILPIAFTLSMERRKNNKTSYFQLGNAHILYPPYTYIQSTGNIYDSLDIEFTDENTDGKIYRRHDPGQFEITKLDTVNKIISGVFTFNLYYESDSVIVTDGRFDFTIGSLCRCSH